jgi:hypothetical protein
MSAGGANPVSTVRLASHKAKRIYLWFFAIVLAAAIALRVEAAIYARRISSVVAELSTLRLGETSKVDTLRRIPALHPSKTGPYGAPICDADECFSGSVGNGLPGRVLWRTRSEVLSEVLRWLGFRAESLEVMVNFKSGKVSYFACRLMLSAPGMLPAGLPPPPPDGKLGAVIIGLSSQKMITVGDPNSIVETHPPYRITPARAVPSQSIGIALTPDAPDEVGDAAFNLRLDCVWSFGGCRRWSQLLPSVEPLTRN